MKKNTFVLAASLAVLLSACGQKESEAPEAPAAPATAPAPETTAPAAPATTPAPESPAAPTAPSEPATTAPPSPDSGASAPATGAATTGAAAGGASSAVGASVFNKTCALCHAAGVAGAPKPGDKADWEPRIAQGKELLYKHAIEGFTGQKGMMPPRGGGASLTDDEVKAAVDYMVEKSS